MNGGDDDDCIHRMGMTTELPRQRTREQCDQNNEDSTQKRSRHVREMNKRAPEEEHAQSGYVGERGGKDRRVYRERERRSCI